MNGERVDLAKTVAENVKGVRTRVGAAARRAGRDPGEVTLVAITKSRGSEVFPALLSAGVTDVGENRALDALEKSRRAPAGLRWHLVGHLQTNKVRKALGLFRTIHSVDSLRLARAIQEEAGKALREVDRALVVLRDELYSRSWDRMLEDLHAQLHRDPRIFDRAARLQEDIGRVELLKSGSVDAFIEINSGEAQKSGLPAGELQEFIREARSLDRIRWIGLMTMAPYADEGEASRPYFRKLRGIRDSARQELPTLHGLSMGMTNDFEVAVEEGSTHVRVGRALFEGLGPE